MQSSLKVSRSIPRSCSNPVFAAYKKYLQCYYSARTLAPADKYLPIMEAPYINLAIIGKGHYDPSQRDEFTKSTLHGGVDQILQNKKPINFEDLLTYYEGRKPVRFVLVDGPPGIGKSTFAWEVCRRWDENFREYNIVVLLKLREKWVLNATSLSDLFRYPPDPDYSKCIAKELNDSHGRDVLLVLDGFDEVSHSFPENSVMKYILCRQLLPNCTIILTTRPSAKHTLRLNFQPQVDKHVEIIGFTEEERVKYITEVFNNEPELQGNFLTYMFLVPHIKSMMYIPLNCAIIAQVYYESQSSQGLAIPKTRTQLYKALTHSLLVRYMKESNHDYSSVLPENLNKKDLGMFKTLAKFAFDSYHKGKSRKVTFFKEDIPLDFAHFGLMNESTEMYASKGVEKTFSFLHLSLQEYLAAWHLANSYGIDFQIAYYGLALSTYTSLQHQYRNYSSCNKEESALLSSIENDRSSLVEPAIFLAGITGCRCQPEGCKNKWEIYLGQEGLEPTRMLVHSLYETQNPNIISCYFAGEDCRRDVVIGLGLHTAHTPYDCYALTYCLQHSLGQVNLDFYINDDDVLLVKIFVKGLIDHCSTTPSLALEHLRLWLLADSVEDVKTCLYHMTKAKFLRETKKIVIYSKSRSLNIAQTFLQSLIKLQHLEVHIDSPTSWEWLTAIKSLSDLCILHISSDEGCCLPQTDLSWPIKHKLTEVVLDIKYSSHDLCSSTDMLVYSLLKSVVLSKSSLIKKMVLPNITRDMMASVHNIIQHCPNLEMLDLKRSRLGYDGIIYICSALRYNTSLKYLVIDEDLQLPPSRITKQSLVQFITFASMERLSLPCKTTCTDFLLELNRILKDNRTLEGMKIQCGLFLPLSAGEHGEYCQWTGRGPLEQFNLRAVCSGISPTLRRSFSLSDLTQSQTFLFWDNWLSFVGPRKVFKVDFKKFFSFRKDRKKVMFTRPSFTAPDTQLLRPFLNLDHRLKECLEISDFHQYLDMLMGTFQGVMKEVSNISLH